MVRLPSWGCISMSVISRLMSLASAGGGGAVGWILELETGGDNMYLARPAITPNYIYVGGTNFSSSYWSGYLIQATHDGELNWQKNLDSYIYTPHNMPLLDICEGPSDTVYGLFGDNRTIVNKFSTNGSFIAGQEMAGMYAEFDSCINYNSGQDSVQLTMNSGEVVRFNGNLTSLNWRRKHNSNRRCNGISTDSAGNSYVVTDYFDSGGGQGIEWIVFKLNTSGSQQWSEKIRGVSGNNDDTPYSVDASSSNNNFYVTGVLQNGNVHVMSLPKSTGGAIVWQKQIAAGLYYHNQGCIVKQDSLGNVYVAVPNASSNTAYIIKFDPNGTVQWKNEINNVVDDGAEKFGFDVTDDFFVLSGNAAGTHSIVLKAPTDGTGTGSYGSYTYQQSSVSVTNGIMTHTGGFGTTSSPSIGAGVYFPDVQNASKSLTLYK